jgi:biopolymer transport protein ExbD
MVHVFFVLLYIFVVFGYALTSDHTPHVELAHQGSYFNQLFRDEPTKSVSIKVHIKNCLSDWSIYFTGLHIIKCMVKDK